MNKIDKIRQLIKDFQDGAMKRFNEFTEIEKKAKYRLSPQSFHDEFVMGTAPQLIGNAWAEVEIAVSGIKAVFSDLEQEVGSWAMKPLDAGTAQVLSCIRDFNLRLSLPELRAIEQDIKGSYFGIRVFVGLANKNGYCANYPTLDECFKNLKAAKNDCELAVRAFCGTAASGYFGRDMLKEQEYNGVRLDTYQAHHWVFAERFLERDSSSLLRLEETLNLIHAPLHYTLSESEAENVRRKVDALFNAYGDFDRLGANELVKEMPDILSKIESLPEKDENVQALEKYYTIDGPNAEKIKKDEIDSEEDSKILATSKIDPMYVAKREPVDKGNLGQFM